MRKMIRGPTLSPAVTSSIRFAKAMKSSRDCQSLLFISSGGKVFLTDRTFPLETGQLSQLEGQTMSGNSCNSYQIKNVLSFLTQEGTRMFKGGRKLERFNCSKRKPVRAKLLVNVKIWVQLKWFLKFEKSMKIDSHQIYKCVSERLSFYLYF